MSSPGQRIEHHRFVLLFLCLISLRLTSTINQQVGRLLRELAPEAAWVAPAAIPSFLAALAIYVVIRPRRPLGGPRADTNWRRLVLLGLVWLLIWLVGSAAAALALGGWVAYAEGGTDVAAFIGFGLLGEELLFRGAIYEAAERAFPATRSAPVLISAIAFSLHHFELHADPWSGATLGQVAFTLPMGIVFARMRQMSERLWPSVLLHVLTNAPGLFGRGMLG